ncbi:urea amidolyase associated protein UAAP1 [Agaribacterium haliotis]|uniref:urea amidolyase associated protein UAAP1 n=1 Tax=Agaribacterium haliotis TaxID=2013869 RepID=UPI000BB58490|nr:urea amidolyase associated protein UAAP1 [Agaribacterium haliotis]
MKLDNYSTTIAGGSHWSFIARRGTQLKIEDIQGGANVGVLFYNPYLLHEKYNAPDTLKCQHTFKLSSGHCLYSDMGRIFASIIEDTFGWHESVCGNSHASHIRERWGARDYQCDSNNWKQNGYDAFLVELAKYGLDRKAMAANLNLFSEVRCDASGELRLARQAEAGDSLCLRFEMDTLVLLHTCPHPLNNASEYPHTPVKLQLSLAEPVREGDFCMNFREENKRGFQNNALYHLGS